MQWEVVVEGIRVGEGPTWRPGRRDVLVTSVHDGVLWQVDPDRSTKRLFGRTGGGPNSLVAIDDGGAVVAQNGGIDMRQFGWPGMDQWPEPSSHPPCLQRLGPDGAASVLAGEGIAQSPNDLVVTADGSIVFTDPPHWPPPDQWIARILRWRAAGAGPWPGASVLDATGRLELLDEAEEYRNGIVLDPDERILIVAGDGLRWLDPDGGRDWFVERLAHGRGDGMAFDGDGTVYVCTGQAVEVVDSGGAIVDRLPLPDGAFVLNCCFGGDDLRTLFVTDAAHNTLLALEGMQRTTTPIQTATAWRHLMDALQELIARDQIHQLADRYAIAVDAKDLEALAALFVEDVHNGRYGPGREGVKVFYDNILRAFHCSMHMVGNHVIDFDDDSHAHGIVYCRAHHHLLDPEHWYDMSLAYWDTYERHDDRWYFRRRNLKSWYRQEFGHPEHGTGRVLASPGEQGPLRGARMPEAFPTFDGYWSREPAPIPAIPS